MPASSPSVWTDKMLLPLSVESAPPRIWKASTAWPLSAAVSIITAKVVLTRTGFHFPLCLLVLQLITCHTFSICRVLGLPFLNKYQSQWGNRQATVLDPAFDPKIWLRELWSLGFKEILSSLTLAIALVCLAESVLHYQNLPVLAMIPLLATVGEGMTSRLLRRYGWTSAKMAPADQLSLLKTLGICLCLGVAMHEDYRKQITGLLFGVFGFLLLGASRALYTVSIINKYTDLPDMEPSGSPSPFYLLSQSMCLIFAAVTAYRWEAIDLAIRAMSSHQSLFFYLNLVFNTIALQIGSNNMSYAFKHVPAVGSMAENFDLNKLSCITTSFSGFLLILMDPLLDNPTWVSKWQIAAWLCAVVISISPESLCLAIPNIANSFSERFDLVNLRQHPNTWRRPLTQFLVNATFVVALMSAIPVYYMHSPAMIPPKTFGLETTNFDQKYTPKYDLDIVVSMYDEDLTNLRRLLDGILTIPQIITLSTRVIIYSKYSHADLYAIRTYTRADSVNLLPNVGRESATYIHHIVKNWDDLAAHTLFVQGTVHGIREVVPKIKEQFVTSASEVISPVSSSLQRTTGFLTLSYTGTCDCNSCDDRWNWFDEFGLLPALYRSVHRNNNSSLISSSKADTCESILLTYNGQFIASAPRIRGVSKDIYKHLLEGLTSDKENNWGRYQNAPRKVSWSGNAGEKDRLDRPMLGDSVERMWGVLMQCSNANVAWNCPSPIGKLRSGGSPWDCQCWDDGAKPILTIDAR